MALAIGLPIGGSMAATPSSLDVQIVDDRGMPIRDAVVEIRPASGWSGAIKLPWRPAMAQKNLQFAPGTLVVAKGSNVAFPNLDQVRHSVYSFSKPARFTIDLYGRDQSRSQGFPIVGTVAVGCNIHDQMRGYVRVVGTPFVGKTDQNGTVLIAGIPGGNVTMVVWHPQARSPGGELSQKIAIAAGRNSRKVAMKLR